MNIAYNEETEAMPKMKPICYTEMVRAILDGRKTVTRQPIKPRPEGVPEDGDYPLENPVYCPMCKGEGLIGAVHPVSLGYMEVDCPHCDTPRKRFSNLWNSAIKPADRPLYGWEANPWVWVIEFERITREEATE